MAGRRTRPLRVPVKQLRRTCDPRSLKLKTTADVTPLEGTVGQDRAVSAMDFGLSIEAAGFNVFVAGMPGTGRSTELRTQLKRIAQERPAPRDWCYVFNFREPARPRALSLPPDRGHQLSHDVEELVAAVRREVPRAFESDQYVQRRDQINRDVQTQRERLFETLEQEARQRSLSVSVTPMGISTVPVMDGKPLTKEQYDLLTEERRHQIQGMTAELDSIIAQMAPQLRRLERSATQLLGELDKALVLAIVSPRLDELMRDYKDEAGVIDFLQALGTDLLAHIDELRAPEDQPQPSIPGLPPMARDGVFDRYKVNVLVTHAADARAPVVFEESPSYYHLFGRIDYRSTFGAMVTDHTMIKPGALHRANGGFLVVQALDVLTAPLVWESLKRALRTRQLRLENMGEQFSVIPTASLSPEPIPLSVKVAMIGTHRIFQMLQTVDEDFQKLFKAKADFTTDVDRIDEHVELYVRFIARQVADLGMRPFDAGAVARVVEQSSRMVADQGKLSLRMMDVVDLLVEADYWACDEGASLVTAAHVDRAIEQQVYRSNLVEERIQEFITDGTIKVDVEGAVAGQVNGLSVFELGDYAFGRPSRITARVSMGRGQVMNLEREIQKSGPSHSKGFLILQGYLNGKFAHRQPLSFAASITFEQVYDEVDGDSASSTELYALLSAITDVPLDQGIAVTGSVNQLGEVQAIGGVNEKIEGFYAVCKARGLTGSQGVMIPKDNVHNLMLKPEVVRAVAEGRFHVWAAASIEEGIELLTGLPAGRLRRDGTYAPGTLFRKVTDALEAMTKRAMEVNRGVSKDEPAPTSVADDGAKRAKKPGTRRR
ncbi:MAG TPA: ATP-binding protein [Dehalococcoidia bacterium]|nr:ATP-binding protein [Dehalococcoidia bacterium]